MNVKPGDLARIVGHPENSMALLRVVRPTTATDSTYQTVRHPSWCCEALSMVVIDGEKAVVPGRQFTAHDGILRKWYDGDGVDEMLLIARPLHEMEPQPAKTT
jgi:hypothetical protein